MPMHNPPHPGEALREDELQALGIPKRSSLNTSDILLSDLLPY